MFSYVLTGLIAYYIYTNASALLAHEGPFTSLQWLMLGMTALFCVLFVIMVRRSLEVYKKSKQEKIEAEKAKSESFRNEDDEIIEVESDQVLDEQTDSSKSIYDE